MNLRGVKCPKCGRKGLHYADHPHAFGHKDYGRITCRFCHGRFREKRATAPEPPVAAPENVTVTQKEG